MQVQMMNAESLSQEQIREFLKSSQRIEFAGCQRREKYAWVERVLGAQHYGALGKGERGVVRAYVEKVTGMSVSQTTRLIRGFLDSGAVRMAPYQRHGFQARYTAEDIALLAEVERAGHAPDSAAGVGAVRAPAVRAAGGNQRGASVQLASRRALPQSGCGVRTDAVVGHRHRRAAQARPARPPRTSARGHGPSGRLGRGQGRVSHQRGRCSDAMAGGGLREQDQRDLPVAGAESGAGAVSFRGVGVSRGQRLGIYQSSSGANAGQAARGVHQKPGVPHAGQRAGGGQERRCSAQANGLRTHRRRARRGDREVLCAAVEPVSESSPTLRLCHGESGRARQTAAPIQDRGLSDTVGETEVAGRGRAIPQAGSEFGGPGTRGAGDERHRVRPKDERRQVAAAPAVQSAGSTSAAVPLAETGGRGNDGAVESVENQVRVFPRFPPPLENPAEPAGFSHSHRPSVHSLEKWKTNDRFSTFPPGARDDDDGSLSEPKNQKKGSRPLRGLLILYAALPPVERNRFHAHPSIGKCWQTIAFRGLPPR